MGIGPSRQTARESPSGSESFASTFFSTGVKTWVVTVSFAVTGGDPVVACAAPAVTIANAVAPTSARTTNLI
ncbi:hypothetical protein GCM10028801_14080 [Nocardioides maradonensis]